jgi:hypothetical protein
MLFSNLMKNETTKPMNKSKCPHCGVKLGNFFYTDACPHCHVELKHNTARLISVPKQDSPGPRIWPVRVFFGLVRLVES